VRVSLKTGAIQLLEFSIEGGLMRPEELASISPPGVDPSRPLIISGRGPQWLYQFFIHWYHFSRLLATFEPRIGKGVVVESPSPSEVGMTIDIGTGMLSEEKIGAVGRFGVDVLKLGGLQLAYVRIEGTFVEPLAMRDYNWDRVRSEVDPALPVVFYGLAPIWLGARVAALLSNMAPWYGVYDPRLGSIVVVARHTPDAPQVGSLMRLQVVAIEHS